MPISWLNLASLLISVVVSFYFYILSVMPATRAEKFGEKAWKDCQQYRAFSGFFFGLMTFNLILWFWFPIPQLSWIIHPNPFIGIFLGLIIAIPCILLMGKGVIDAGKETMHPSADTKMYKGIYRHIRHPQILGEMPLFIVITLFLNSLFLLILVSITIVLIIPIMIHYEEKDLMKRFGNAYEEYRQQTGALIPKLKKREKKV
jgi:protein-S-isoprenylcysteine O-methyltransferase Ste14